MAFWTDDLDLFFGDFAVDVIWDEITYKGIFHNEYEAVGLFEGQVESKNPYIEVKSTDFEDVTIGDTIIVDGEEYKAKTSPHSDGTGISIIELSKD